MFNFFNKRVKEPKPIRFSKVQAVSKTFTGWGSWTVANGFGNEYVFMCVNEILKNLNSVQWCVEVKSADGWVRDDKHTLNSIVNKPNLHGTFTKLIKECYINYDLSGNFLLHKIRGVNNSIIGLECIPAHMVTPKVDNSNSILYYEFRNGSNRVRIETCDMIHGMFYNPSNSAWGLSKLDALHRTLDCDDKAAEWNKSSMENRGVTDGAFVFDEILSADEVKEAREEMKEKYTNVSIGREPWFLHGGVKWLNMSRSPVEMDYMSSRKFNREAIAGAFGVPLLLLGVLEKSSYNNLETSKKLLWQDTIIPLLDDFFETINFDIAQEFGENVRISYDLSNVSVLAEDRSKKIDDALKLKSLGLGIDTINKVLDLGLSEDDLTNKNSNTSS